MNKKLIVPILASSITLLSLLPSCTSHRELPSGTYCFSGTAYFTGFSVEEDTISAIYFSLKNNSDYTFTLKPQEKSVSHYLRNVHKQRVCFEAKPLRDSLSYSVVEKYFSIK